MGVCFAFDRRLGGSRFQRSPLHLLRAFLLQKMTWSGYSFLGIGGGRLNGAPRRYGNATRRFELTGRIYETRATGMRTENGAGRKGRRRRARRQGPVVGETVQPWLVAAHGSLVDVVVSGDASVCCRAVAGKGLRGVLI